MILDIDMFDSICAILGLCSPICLAYSLHFFQTFFRVNFRHSTVSLLVFSRLPFIVCFGSSNKCPPLQLSATVRSPSVRSQPPLVLLVYCPSDDAAPLPSPEETAAILPAPLSCAGVRRASVPNFASVFVFCFRRIALRSGKHCLNSRLRTGSAETPRCRTYGQESGHSSAETSGPGV